MDDVWSIRQAFFKEGQQAALCMWKLSKIYRNCGLLCVRRFYCVWWVYE